MKNTIVVLLCSLSLSSCLQDEPFKSDYAGFEPQTGNDDWTISSPESENMDRSILSQAYALVYKDTRFLMARSLLVFRNGKLVAEAYPNNPNDINGVYNIQSCTKSVTSLLTGMAVHENLISSLDEKLYDIFPEDFDSNPEKRSITIEDALTMRTGLEFNNDEHTLKLYQEKNSSVAFILSMQRLYPSGMVMNYNDGAPHLISKVIKKKTGKNLSEYATQKLFAPLNINDWIWEASHDGVTFGAISLFLRPRDFGKIGQLLLQNGKWNNATLIDSLYLSQATSIQVSANFHSEPYGYYFWILPAYNGYCALGHGGQFLLVVPEKNLVVVYTAWPYTSGNFFDQHNELMNIIVNSCN